MKDACLSSKYDVIILIAGRISQLLYSFLAIKLLTNMLPVGEVGVYYLLISTIVFVSMVLVAPVGSYHTKNLNHIHEKNYLFSSFFAFAIYIVVAIILILPFLYWYLESSESIDMSFFPIFSLITIELIFGTISATVINSFNMIFHRVRFVVYMNIVLFLGLLLALCFVQYFEFSAWYWLLGISLAKAIATFFVVLDFKRLFCCKVNFKYIRVVLFSRKQLLKTTKYCMPILIGALATWSQTNYYRFYTSEYFDLSVLAYLSLGFAIATNLFSALESLINQYFMPYLYKAVSDKNVNRDEVFSLVFNSLIPIYLAFAIFLMYFSPLVIKLIASTEYSESYIYMLFGIGIELVRVVTRLLTHVFYIESCTKSGMLASVFGGSLVILLLTFSVNIITNEIILIPIYLLFGASASLIIVLLKLRRLVKINFNITNFITVSLFSLCLYLIPFSLDEGLFYYALFIAIAFCYFIGIQYYFNKSIFSKLA